LEGRFSFEALQACFLKSGHAQTSDPGF